MKRVFWRIDSVRLHSVGNLDSVRSTQVSQQQELAYNLKRFSKITRIRNREHSLDHGSLPGVIFYLVYDHSRDLKRFRETFRHLLDTRIIQT